MTPSNIPKITIITPSFNQGHFLEDTIRSVLGQLYPRLEYFIIDGGSSDNSVEIIRRHESSLAGWVSEPDSGQTQAINKGFARATGDILAWINSDDLLMPGALWDVASWYHHSGDQPALLYGGCLFYRDPHGTGQGLPAKPFLREQLFLEDFIYQPSAFWTRSLWEKTGPLNESLDFAFDWEWWIRASLHGRFTPINRCLSIYRIHAGHKTTRSGNRREQELLDVINRFAPRDIQDLYSAVHQHRSHFRKQAAFTRFISRHHLPFQGILRHLLFPHLSHLNSKFGANRVNQCARMFLYPK